MSCFPSALRTARRCQVDGCCSWAWRRCRACDRWVCRGCRHGAGHWVRCHKCPLEHFVPVLAAQLGAGTADGRAAADRGRAALEALRARLAAQQGNAVWWRLYVTPLTPRAARPVLGTPSGPPGGLLLPPGWSYCSTEVGTLGALSSGT